MCEMRVCCREQVATRNTARTERLMMTIKANRNAGGGGVAAELGPCEWELPGVQVKSETRSPFTLKHILVPIDFSDCSKKALRYAVALAKQFGARLHLV